ncbi:MAG: MBL fold metallo-hydrolase [Candidatus Nitrosocaldus sp.]|nr:MBL fold metallo-hydrolase [Candidatus Nitrosocaldus sp.]
MVIAGSVRLDGCRVYVIDTLALGSARAVACYLILADDGRSVLVDTGYASSVEEVRRTLAELRISHLDYIVPTHLHLDHAGAAGYLARDHGSPIIAHERAVRHLIDPTRLVESVRQVFGAQADLFGYPIAIDPTRSTITGVRSAGEHTLSIGGMELRFMGTEGHAPHQISVYVNSSKPVLITADAVSMLYPDYPYCYIPTTPLPAFDAEQALATVERLRRVDVEALLMPHFGVSHEPDSVFDATTASIKEWLGMIKGLLDDGYSSDAVEDEMIGYVRSKGKGKGNDAPPQYVLNSVRNSVKGIIGYLKRGG